MTRRHVLTGAACAVAAPMLNLGACRLFGSSGRLYSTRAIDLVAESLVVDMLGLLTMDWAKLDRWHAKPTEFSADDFACLAASGVSALHPAVDLNTSEPHDETLSWLRRWKGFLGEHAQEFLPIGSSRDLADAKKSGRIGIVMGMQNSGHFRDVSDVALFHAEGQRISQLTYNSGNRLGSGCSDRFDNGLTHFGADIVRSMNQTGMAIDVSHTSERTTLNAIEVSAKPVLITHANCRALVKHPRCKSDTVIKALAKKGGVMGITGVRAFLSERGRATIEDVLDHFDHVAKLAGIEHLGIGSDAGLDTTRPAPHLEVEGLHHPGRVFDLAEGLLRRGYSTQAAALVLGGNFQRVFASVFSS